VAAVGWLSFMKHALLLDAADVILLRAGLAVGAAMGGALLAALLGGIGHRPRCALISLAAGCLLAVGAIGIFPEVRELLGLSRAAGAMAVGVLVFFLVSKYLYFICPACSATATDHDRGFVQLSWLLIAAGAFHALMDGIAIALGAEVGGKIGVLVLAAVAAHKIPEGMALVAIGLQAGQGRLGALLIALMVEMMTALGSSVGLLAGEIPLAGVGIALGVAGGSFLYVGVFALAAEMGEHERTSIAVWAGLGFFALAALLRLLPE